MRILVISNLYPPYYLGGYELRCQEVVKQLQNRGHKVVVLTSRYGLRGNNDHPQTSSHAQETYIFRVLHFVWHIQVDLGKLYRIELDNHSHFRRLVKQFHPDIFYIWNCGGLGKSLLIQAQSYHLPVVYHFEDDWFLTEFWYDPWLRYCTQEHPINVLRAAYKVSRQRSKDSEASQTASTNTFALPKPFSRYMLSYIPKPMVYRLLGKWMSRRLPLGFANIDLRHACFVSDFRKQQYLEAGLPVENAIVIPGGVDIRKFKTSQPQKSFTELIKILCAAQLYKGKGIHTAIDAIDLLLKQGYKNISLTISGEELGGTEYTEFLDKKVQRSEALMKSVKFTGKVSYDKMPEIYHYHDWFISASIIPEGFPLTIIEAMASGLVVFATGTGGGREVLQHNENGMVFPPGDPEALASQMKFIIQHPEIQRKLSENALKTAQKFDIQPVATTIETYLEAILGLKT